MSVGVTTQYIVALGYGASVPAGAMIDGITVQVERNASSGVRAHDQDQRLAHDPVQRLTGRGAPAPPHEGASPR
jgi:hypothetical protein